MASALRPVVDVGDAAVLNEKQLEDNYAHQPPVADREPSVAEYLYYADEQREKEAALIA